MNEATTILTRAGGECLLWVPGHDSQLFEFIAGKPPLKFRFPEAAIRH